MRLTAPADEPRRCSTRWPPPVSDKLERAALGRARGSDDHLPRRPRAVVVRDAGSVRGDCATVAGGRIADLVPRDGLPDRHPCVEELALLRRRRLARRCSGSRIPGTTCGTAAGLKRRTGPGDPARRRATHDLLPAVRRRRLQLHVGRRAGARRVAVGTAVGRRHPQGFLRPVQSRCCAGERRHRRLQPRQWRTARQRTARPTPAGSAEPTSTASSPHRREASRRSRTSARRGRPSASCGFVPV